MKSTYNYDQPITSLICCFQVFDVAINTHKVIQGLDIYEKVGRAVAHDEYVPFTIVDNQLHINGETLPFTGSVYVEFVKVSRRDLMFYHSVFSRA